ncbi:MULTISPECIES: hypothetical protein [unclassified Streptomyces]|uniref:hypothetical protein n=1 Tax=unclassified Streptomyces TaxID=2593676 RepID=UPI00136A7DB5|nr:hypothetical protein [Streptomyces sp. SID6139]MYR21232.1 hypothetical protein [Streptomyces sp. SID6137]
MNGIAFTGTLRATVASSPPYPLAADDIVDAVRAALRGAAKDAALRYDPTDIPTARDLCARHLRKPRDLLTDPPISYQGRLLTLALSPANQAAVDALLAAQRNQSIKDSLRLQRQRALIAGLTDPAVALAHYLEGTTGSWDKLPGKEILERVSKTFSAHRPDEHDPVEYALVEVVRDFLNTFEAPEQRRMLVTLLAGGMSQAQRPLHAARAATLLNGQAHLDPTEAP